MITLELIKHMEKRDKLYRLTRTYPTNEEWSREYKKYKNIVNKKRAQLKKEYFARGWKKPI